MPSGASSDWCGPACGRQAGVVAVERDGKTVDDERGMGGCLYGSKSGAFVSDVIVAQRRAG
jgi:hypothetical protein